MKLIVDMAGGFGNQLFCYSFGYALAREKKAKLLIDTSMQDNGVARKLELLNLQVKYDKRVSYKYSKSAISRVAINKIRRRFSIGFCTTLYEELSPTVYEPNVCKVSRNTYFKGNWQCEKYFTKYREELLQMFVPCIERSDSVKTLIEEMQVCNSVAVHVRRGDYVQIGCQLEGQYYENAIDLLQKMFSESKTVLYVFSDDVEYCKKYFGDLQAKDIIQSKEVEIKYPEYESDNTTLDDLILMSNCKHMIMANSSYSWWAAWLNKNREKRIICPELGIWKGDFYPEDWIKIRCE